jgi:Fe-S-cluster-containing dehydrogenase component
MWGLILGVISATTTWNVAHTRFVCCACLTAPVLYQCPTGCMFSFENGAILKRFSICISENFRNIGNRFVVRTNFNTKHTLCGALMKTGALRDAQQSTQRVYNIPCECGRYYIGESSRPLRFGHWEHSCI